MVVAPWGLVHAGLSGREPRSAPVARASGPQASGAWRSSADGVRGREPPLDARRLDGRRHGAEQRHDDSRRGGQPSSSRPFQSAGTGGGPRKRWKARNQLELLRPGSSPCFLRLGRRGSLSWSCAVRLADRPQRRQVSPSRSGRAQRQARAKPAPSLIGRKWHARIHCLYNTAERAPASRTSHACANTVGNHDARAWA